MSKRNESIGVQTPKSFKHDLSHSHTTTIDWFRLQPVCCMEMLDGDKFSVNLASLIEAAPLATKVFGSAYLDFHAFFVPSRVLWSDWNNYRYGNSRTGGSNYVIPHFKTGEFLKQIGAGKVVPTNEQYVYEKPSLTYHQVESRRVLSGLGYPTSGILNTSGDGSLSVSTGLNDMLLSAMQARAYQRIWWDWFRDSVHIQENSKNSYIYNTGGAVTALERVHLYTARYRCWRKDYITTLLESPQLGNVSTLPVNLASSPASGNRSSAPLLVGNTGSTIFTSSNFQSNSIVSEASFNSNVSLLRGAIAMQRFLEKLNVTGTRPIERMQAIFGNSPSPVRLDMSEFIASHRQRVTISGLTNTGSASIVDTSQSGDRNAFGIDGFNASFGQQTGRSYGESQSKNMSYSATEDGYFIVIASLMPDYVNPTAVNRQFLRGLSTPDASVTDFYTHEFDGLSYQECLYNEISQPEYTPVTQGLWGVDYDPFAVAGYQPKYEDYRYQQDRLSGDFNEPSAQNALRNMVYVRNFQDQQNTGSVPSGLDLTTPLFADRAQFDNHFQVSDSTLDHFILNLFINVDAVRPVSKAELPTELSDFANSKNADVSNGGIRL